MINFQLNTYVQYNHNNKNHNTRLYAKDFMKKNCL